MNIKKSKRDGIERINKEEFKSRIAFEIVKNISICITTSAE